MRIHVILRRSKLQRNATLYFALLRSVQREWALLRTVELYSTIALTISRNKFCASFSGLEVSILAPHVVHSALYSLEWKHLCFRFLLQPLQMSAQRPFEVLMFSHFLRVFDEFIRIMAVNMAPTYTIVYLIRFCVRLKTKVQRLLLLESCGNGTAMLLKSHRLLHKPAVRIDVLLKPSV